MYKKNRIKQYNSILCITKNKQISQDYSEDVKGRKDEEVEKELGIRYFFFTSYRIISCSILYKIIS